MKPQIGSLLVLTEDSGSDAHATVVEVVKRMLRLIVPHYQTQRVGFEPRDASVQRAMRGNRWKSTDPRDYDDVVQLMRTIATRLARNDGFVFFHIDGDRPWSERESSENVTKFYAIVTVRVRQLLRGRGAEGDDPRLRKLIPVVPYYSIESWLYQNSEAATKLCRERYQGRDLELFERWQRQRDELDDVVQPKEKTCLGAQHNLELAGSGYPAGDVFDAGRSYAESVWRALDCGELKALLDATTAT